MGPDVEGSALVVGVMARGGGERKKVGPGQVVVERSFAVDDVVELALDMKRFGSIGTRIWWRATGRSAQAGVWWPSKTVPGRFPAPWCRGARTR